MEFNTFLWVLFCVRHLLCVLYALFFCVLSWEVWTVAVTLLSTSLFHLCYK